MIRWVDNMEKKRIVTIIIAAIVLLGVGYGGYSYYETKPRCGFKPDTLII